MTRRVPIGDRDDVEVAEVWFETMSEPWSEYLHPDTGGTDGDAFLRLQAAVELLDRDAS